MLRAFEFGNEHRRLITGKFPGGLALSETHRTTGIAKIRMTSVMNKFEQLL